MRLKVSACGWDSLLFILCLYWAQCKAKFLQSPHLRSTFFFVHFMHQSLNRPRWYFPPIFGCLPLRNISSSTIRIRSCRCTWSKLLPRSPPFASSRNVPVTFNYISSPPQSFPFTIIKLPSHTTMVPSTLLTTQRPLNEPEAGSSQRQGYLEVEWTQNDSL